MKVPSPTTTLALFQYYLDICGPASRETVAVLAQFAPTASARDILLKLGRSKEAYATFLHHNYVNLGRLLEYSTVDEQTVWNRLPFSFLVESIPPMQPRYYSISSSSIVHPREAALTAVVIGSPSTASDSVQLVPGLATNYMHAVKQATGTGSNMPKTHLHGLTYPLAFNRLHAHIRKCKFKLSVRSSNPIIMVGAGTGIAPFRAFVQERARLMTMGREVGPMTLFYGCRRPDEDYYYRD